METANVETFELPERIKEKLNQVFSTYQSDASKIRERVQNYRSQLHSAVPREEIKESMLLPESQPPVLMRFAVSDGTDGTYIWKVPDIAIVLERHRSKINSNIAEIAKDERYKDKIKTLRVEAELPNKIRYYLYKEEIFDLILDHYARQYIKERIITPRRGKPLPEDVKNAVWEYWDTLCNGDYIPNDAASDNRLGITSAAADDTHGSLIFDSEEIPVKLRKILSECFDALCSNKLMSAAVILVVNFTDISKKSIWLYYLLPLFILPAMCAMFYFAKYERDSAKRQRCTSYLAYTFIAALMWGVSFTGRVFNDDLSKSAVPDVVQQIQMLTQRQEETAKNVEKISAKVETLAEKSESRNADLRNRASELISDTQQFISRASSDMSGIDTYDYERMIDDCKNISAILPADMADEKAVILLAESDIYQLWGLTDAQTAYSKYENAIDILQKASQINGISKARIAAIYTNMGIIYTQMGDLKNRTVNLQASMESFNAADEYVENSDVKTQTAYYIGRGSLLTAMTEIGNYNTDTERDMLEQSKAYLEKALKLAKGNNLEHETNVAGNEIAIADRRLSILLAAENRDTSIKLCRESLSQCEKELDGLNIEMEPYHYVHLKFKVAELSIQLNDFLSGEATYLRRQNNKEDIQKNITERAEILDKAYKAIMQAKKFNNGEYIDPGQIYYKTALILSRHAELLGGDRDKYEQAFSMYNAALKEYPENESLLRNMEVATNNAVTLYNAGIILRDAEYINQAQRISDLYLKEYSSTGYSAFLQTLKTVSDGCKKFHEN